MRSVIHWGCTGLMAAGLMLNACAPASQISSAGQRDQTQLAQSQTAQATMGVTPTGSGMSGTISVGAGVGFSQTTTTVTTTFSPAVSALLAQIAQAQIAQYLPGEFDRYADAQRPAFERFQPDVIRALAQGEQMTLSLPLTAGGQLRLVGQCGAYCQAATLQLISPDGQLLDSVNGRTQQVLDITVPVTGIYRVTLTLTGSDGVHSAHLGLLTLIRR